MKTNAIAKIPTEQINFGERVLGRLVKMELTDPNEFEPVEIPEQSAIDLSADVFWNLYRSKTKPVDEIPQERRINRSLIDWMRETPGFEKSLAHSVGNLPVSTMSAALLTHHLQSDEVMGELLRQQNEIDKMANDRDRFEMEADAFDAAADSAEQNEPGDGDPTGDGNGDEMTADDWREMADEKRQQSEQLSEQINALVGAMSETLENAKNDPITAAAMSAATRDAGNESESTAKIMTGFGLSGASDVRTDPAAAFEFVNMIDDDIALIAEMAGRIKGFAIRAYRERVQIGPVLTKIGLTQKLTDVMPSELALLRHDAPRAIRAGKIAELVETGLMGYQPTGDGEKSGDFVFGLDESGSMSLGDRLLVGRAVGLGLAMAARELGRGFILFSFAAKYNSIRFVTSNDDWRAVIDWASYAADGGTDFDMAIEFAMDKLTEMDGAQNADLVFASDGEGHVSDDTIESWRKFETETGARMFYVPVDKSSEQYANDMSDYFNIGQIAFDVFPTPNWNGDGAVELGSRVASDWR